MNRKSFLRDTSLLAGGALLLRQPAFARLFDATAGSLRMLRKGVGIYTERGGTIGFHTDEGITVIDSQFPEPAAAFIGEIRKTSDRPFTHLLYTHHHGDHTGGGISFKGMVKNVVAHTSAAANHRDVASKPSKDRPAPEQLFADTTFDSKLKIKEGDAKLMGYYFGPGHTNGDAVYHFEGADVVHVGDLVFNRRHPFVDRKYGASMVNWVKALDAIIDKFGKETLYIFGHAGTGFEVTGSAGDVLAFREYLQRVLDFTAGAIKAGKTREEFIKNIEIPGVTEWKGDGIERPLGAAWDELTASPQ